MNLDHHVGDNLTSRALTVLDLRFESFPSTSCSGRPVGMEASTWWTLNQRWWSWWFCIDVYDSVFCVLDWWSYLRKMIMMMFTSELQYMPSLTRVSPNLFSRLWRRFNIILIIVVVLGIWMIVTSLIIIMILKTTSEGNGRPTCIGSPLVLLSTCT